MDNILLTPTISNVTSRNDVDTSIQFKHTKLDIPIIASPMKGITSPALIDAIYNLGGIGIIHRFNHLINRLTQADEFNFLDIKFGAAIGLGDSSYKRFLDYGPTIICIDIANGYLTSLHKFAKEVADYITKNNYKCDLMTGNVVTYKGAKALQDSGVDIIRVGIGTGSLCSTTSVTGVGYPYDKSLVECSLVSSSIVADGGMKSSGDIVKAIALGAKAVMIGSLFGKAFESSHNGIIRGMASKSLQEEYYHNVKSVEGIEREIKKTDSLENIVNELVWGIKSACTYLNVEKLNELGEVYYTNE